MAPGPWDHRPLLVFWEVTRACRLACLHCRASAIPDPLPGELTTGEGEALIEDLARFGTPAPVLVLTGGDPLMRPDLFHLIGRAREAGMPVALAPSVTPLLTPRVMTRLRAAGVESVSVSLDGGAPSTHEGIRGEAGHFARTLEAIDGLVAEGFRVQVNTAVMRVNVEELARVAGIVGRAGAQVWEVFFLVRVGRGIDMEELTPEENEEVAHFLVDVSRYGFTVRTVEGPFHRRVAAWRREAGEADPVERFGLGDLYRRLAAGLLRELGPPGPLPRGRSAGTRDGKGILFIAHDGKVHPAGFLPLALGEVRTHSVVDLYRRHPLLRAIRTAAFSGRCGVCEFRDLCGGSRARAWAAGDPLGEDPACAHVPAGVRETGA